MALSLLDQLKRNYNRKEPERPSGSQDDRFLSVLSQNLEQDKRNYPDNIEDITKFAKLLQTEIKQHMKKRFPGSEGVFYRGVAEAIPVDGTGVVFLSEDRMAAYLCLLPPLSGGHDADEKQVLEDLHFEGVSYGVDEELLNTMVKQKQYLHIVIIAKGTPARDGDAAVIENFFKQKDVLQLECEEGTRIDFDEKNLFQAVHRKEVICRLTPAKIGTDGRDVTGRLIRSKGGAGNHLAAGMNTVLSQDGLFIMAEIDGLLCVRNGLFCVDRQKVIFGDVDETVGDLDYPGNILVKGNVLEGRTLRASGNIIVEGEVRNAYLVSGGSVRIQQGIHGGRKSTIQAAKQVQSKIIEETTVTAGGSIFTEVIKDSNITTSGSIYAEGGRGYLIGGQVKVRYAIKALKIGNRSGCLNIIILNYNPELKNKVWEAQDQLNATKTVLDDLRKNISALRAKFKTLLADEKKLLTKLTEQRELYEKQEANQAAALVQLQKELNDVSGCFVLSEEINPTTVIRLGEKSLTIQELQNHCNVRIVGNSLRER